MIKFWAQNRQGLKLLPNLGPPKSWCYCQMCLWLTQRRDEKVHKDVRKGDAQPVICDTVARHYESYGSVAGQTQTQTCWRWAKQMFDWLGHKQWTRCRVRKIDIVDKSGTALGRKLLVPCHICHFHSRPKGLFDSHLRNYKARFSLVVVVLCVHNVVLFAEEGSLAVYCHNSGSVSLRCDLQARSLQAYIGLDKWRLKSPQMTKVAVGDPACHHCSTIAFDEILFCTLRTVSFARKDPLCEPDSEFFFWTPTLAMYKFQVSNAEFVCLYGGNNFFFGEM